MPLSAMVCGLSGAEPSLRIIFPVKKIFGYCGYSETNRMRSERAVIDSKPWFETAMRPMSPFSTEALNHWLFGYDPRHEHA
jgi:hypothetical protein